MSRIGRARGIVYPLAVVCIVAFPAAAVAQVQELPAIQVIANTPLQGSGVDRDKIPSTTYSVDAADFQRSYSPNVTDTLFQRIPGITLSDPNGNSAQQEIRYRGFAASPSQGTPQGLAVYMNGIRINESFGDTVNWDLIPTNAIQRADVLTGNPIFGLNALGGAISLQMKNGFTWQGLEQELQGGSYGRAQGATQYGAQWGNWSTYIAAQAMRDDGWRKASPTKLGRFYGDVGWRDDKAEFHIFSSVASTTFGVAAATPIQLLNQSWNSIYTTPQTTRNEMAMVGVNGKYALTDTWSLQGNLYTRLFHQTHVDGNDADIERCSAASSFPTSLCLEDDGFARPVPFVGAAALAFRNQFVILDANNKPIPCPPGAGNTCAPVPYGTIDRTDTQSKTFGGSLQATNDDKIFGHGNHFVVGGSIDNGNSAFNANSTLGFISPDLSVGINPAIPGNGSIIHTARQCRIHAGRHQYQEYLLRTLLHRHLRYHREARSHRRRALQRRQNIGTGRHGLEPGSEQRLDLLAFQSGGRRDLQDRAVDHRLWQLFGVQPRADAAGARLLQPHQAVSAGKLPGIRSAAAAGGRPHL